MLARALVRAHWSARALLSTPTPQEYMSRFLRARAFGAALVASVVLGACSDQTISPTAAPPVASRKDVIQGDTAIIASISQVIIPSRTITIGAPAPLLTTTVVSRTSSFFPYRVRASILQQQFYTAFEVPIPCREGQASCTFSTPLALPPQVFAGPVQLVLDVVDADYDIVVDRLFINITIAGTQSITALSPGSTAPVIGGASSGYTATIKNTDVNLSGAAVQGWIIQSGPKPARRAAATAAVQCGGGSGVLPMGMCSISGSFLASNTAMGSGTLLPGPAVFELDLVVNGVVVTQKSVNITLSSSASITGITLNSTRGDTALIEGASVPYTATLKNVGASVSGLALQGTIVQGSAHRFADGGALSCTTTSGVLPNGTCTFAGQLTATNNTAGDGTLISGSATFQVQLVDAGGNVLSTANIPLTLVEGPLTSPPPGPDSNADRSPRSSGALARP